MKTISGKISDTPHAVTLIDAHHHLWDLSMSRHPWLGDHPEAGFFLGDGLDTDQIHATYENGVLTVTVPVADRAKPRRIEVTSEAHKEAITAATG